MLESLMSIDEIRLNFSDDNRILLNLTIALIMFGISLELKPDDFRRLFKYPKPVAVGILSQFLLMPAVTFLIALSLRNFITPTVGMGMILVAACPGGNVSNFISSLSKGNVALSVSLTAFSSIGGLILTPLNFTFWGNLYMKFYNNGVGDELVKTLRVDILDVFSTILLILAVPLVLGIFVNLKYPQFTSKLIIPMKRFSIFAFAAMIVIIFTSNYDSFIENIKYIFVLVLIHNILAFASGYYLATAFKLTLQDRKTISIETGIQNSGLALALLFNPMIFPADVPIGGMAFIAAWWGIWHIISGLSLASYWSGFSLKPTKVSD